MSVKAKFCCSSIAKHNWGSGRIGTEIKMHAVQGKSGSDSQDFADATPNGHLEFIIAPDRAAADFFEVGKDYYLTFEAE